MMKSVLRFFLFYLTSRLKGELEKTRTSKRTIAYDVAGSEINEPLQSSIKDKDTVTMFALNRQLGSRLRLLSPEAGIFRSLHASTVLRAAGDFQITSGKVQIYRIKDMLERVAQTNRPKEKVAIIKEYEDLRPIVEM
jgi:hypothetical protein